MSLTFFRRVILGVTFPVTISGTFLVILDLFIVTTPVDDPFEIGLPYSETAEVLESFFTAVAVRVEDDGFVQVEWWRVSEVDVVEAVSPWLRGRSWVVVSADTCVPYGAVKRVVERLGEAGIARISLRTAKAPPEQ